MNDRPARFAAIAFAFPCAVLALLAAVPQARAADAPARLTVRPPAAALSEYRLAIAHLPRPPNMVFQYAQTRSGPVRVVTEQHRVYRNLVGKERNETISFNGVPIAPVIVRIFSRSPWPYFPDRFFVSGELYNAQFRGMTGRNRQRAYSFALARPTPADFSLTGLQIDALRYLPVRETFDVTAGNCSGPGWIAFGPVAKYWLPREIAVTCTSRNLPGTGLQTPAAVRFRESLRFSGWQFPPTVPSQVFGAAPQRQGPASPKNSP
ncbi:MAG: hypothetical protein GIW99_04270 [Candidatus Eremiobacteraeota bacterium]|nr:hypothetical protein [Candidatus Eremiobacteraeota bacterium]MBC5826888.1 hypothetical protein [Candidatus Eremiobacteraeota bacterium]